MSKLPHYPLALLLGALATLALPPFYLVPLLLLSFCGLLLLLEKCGAGKRAFWTGWAFGFAHHVTGLYWICNSLLVDAKHFAWLIPFTISLIPAYVALYTGLVCWLVFRSKLTGWRRVVLFACLWTLGEMARSYMLTGFPWNLIGYAWSGFAPVAQAASVVGVYGLGFLTVLVAAMPVLWLRKEGRKASCVANFAAVKLLLLAMLVTHLGTAGVAKENPTSFKVRVVQPNIKQEMKWDEQGAMDALEEHLRLTGLPYENAAPQVVVWPESAIPYRLEDDAHLREVIADALPPSALLIIGSVRVNNEGGTRRIYNSLQVMDKQGKILATYDKHHLVPFGEYVPLRWIWPFIEKITQGGLDFSAGSGPATLEVPGLPPFSPLICYEAIFPGQVKDSAHPPAWLVNVTNDAWFGDSTGPHQHLAMTQMRAIEEGIPVVRSANTGISSAGGKTLPLNTAGILDETVVYSAEGLRTPYSRYGILIPLLLVVIGGVTVYIPKKRCNL